MTEILFPHEDHVQKVVAAAMMIATDWAQGWPKDSAHHHALIDAAERLVAEVHQETPLLVALQDAQAKNANLEEAFRDAQETLAALERKVAELEPTGLAGLFAGHRRPTAQQPVRQTWSEQ